MAEFKKPETKTEKRAAKADIDSAPNPLMALAEKLGKRYDGKKPVVLRSDKAPGLEIIPRFPTGSFVVDMAIGGGFPAGRISMLWGKKSSFKTTLCLKTVAQAQKLCRRCFKVLDDDGSFQIGRASCRERV